jgi:hypothetical protein
MVKMNKQAKITLLAFSIFTLCSVFGAYLFMGGLGFVGATTEDSVVSNATIATSIGFTFSENLSLGILFGEVNPDSADNNATGNNLSAGNTAYYITMDSANNENTDTCIKAPTALTSGGNSIANGNYTYDASTTIDGAGMNDPADSVAMTDTYAKFGGEDIAPDASQYMQFYLDVPALQPSGVYANTISFKIISTGGSCMLSV